MVKKTKKAMLLLGLVSVMALAGCGGNSDSGNDSTEGVTIKYYWPGSMGDEDIKAVQEELSAYTKEKIGCEVALAALDQGAWNQKAPLMLSSGEEVDLMFSANWASYVIQSGQNSYLDLTELLEKHGQGIKEELPAEWLEAAKVNGKLYGIPSIKDIAQGYGLYMDKQILAEAGLTVDDIKTLEDIEPVLEYIKNNKPEMTPLPKTLESGNVWLATEAALKEGYSDNSKIESGFDSWGGIIGFDKAADKFVLLSPENSEVFSSAARLMSKWYNKGYFSADIIANATSTSATSLWKEGKGWYYVSSDTPGRRESTENSINPKAAETPEGYVRKEVVLSTLMQPIANTASMTGSLTTIPRASKHPEEAMKFLNLLLTDEKVNNLLAHGQENVNYKKVEGQDDIIEAVKVGDFNWQHAKSWFFGNVFKQYTMNTTIPNYKEALQEYNDAAARSALIGFNFDSNSMKNECAAVNSIWAQYKKIFYTGTGDVEQNLKEYFGKIETAGINEIVEEYNRQYQEWKKTK